jgi:phosphoglycerol transferase MdoB-like AlkP superfamily enzyme
MQRRSHSSPAQDDHGSTVTGGLRRDGAASRFRALGLAGGVFLAVAFALRVALFLKMRGEGDLSLVRLPLALGAGAVYDVAAFGYAAIPFVLYVALVPDAIWRWRAHRVLATALWCAFVYALLLEATAEWFFFEEFGARFNFVAVDYLVYTGEVVGNIRETYPVGWILPGLAVVTALVVAVTRRSLASAFDAPSPLRGRLKAGLACLAVPTLAFAALDDRLAHVGENRYENELAMNGVYAFGDAFRKNSLSYDTYYATRDPAAVYSRLRDILSRDGSVPVSADPTDLRRRVEHEGPETRHNVVLVTVESLGARHLEFSGTKFSKLNTTPRLDALAKESLLFTRMYSTGTRTVRGLEALTLSIPPTPGQSVVKRPGNENLFSTGFLFRERGYDAKFVYGGYGLFDNMNAFFESNGFESVDRTDFAEDERTFGNVWGVCDEDLFRRVGREADASHAAGRPFFLHVMTTSNHQPYTYPEGRIDIPSGTGRAGSVKYTDYAIGKFLDDARTRPWFDDTIFVIVGDHTDNGRGFSELPVDRFHIACLVYAPKIVPPGRFDGVCSQIDLPPTLLGLLNWSYETKFFGQDVMRHAPDRALVCNYLHVGLYDGRRLATLGPHHDLAVDEIDRAFRPHGAPADETFALDAISYYEGASEALEHGLLGRILVGH